MATKDALMETSLKMYSYMRESDENNRGNGSLKSRESINRSPQVVGQYLMYPRRVLDRQLGHSTVAKMGGKSDRLSGIHIRIAYYLSARANTFHKDEQSTETLRTYLHLRQWSQQDN